MKVFCYYHSDDMDGWSSSAIVSRKYPNAEFYGYNYEAKIKLVKGYDKVFMVDCSTTAKNMKYLMDNNEEFIWIDHHAKKILDTYKELGNDIPGIRDTGNISSACVLTWKYLFPDNVIPGVLKSIEDMDIWNWRLKDTDEINTALFIDYRDRKWLNKFMNSWDGMKSKLIEKGKVYIHMRNSQIDCLLKNMRVKNFHGFSAGVVNTPLHSSFVGHEILQRNPDIDIAILWYSANDVVRVSLRSRDVDVAKIASVYGGGGHKLASGFSLKNNDLTNRDVYIW